MTISPSRRSFILASAVLAELQGAADRALKFGLLRQRLEVARAIDTGFPLDPARAPA
ncbi:hypothetical protein SAMN02745194_04141 [Roseomonas rosea]|uniref:Uncharacterized protein n=1 Tax=Muricoccus roseus TaxID=198092 RepID=A0A1M6PLS6_9PROT|nr:hypothetical protein [Roseomonas rosea]SHK08882.1 hypothetical protein SAMN02745194_04141 [Roseomonas rosea]